MQDITDKIKTLRTSVAQAMVKVSDVKTLQAILRKEVPKGDVFEMSKAAGLLAIKKTPLLIPDCHPIPIEASSISFSTDQLTILITVEVKTIYKTGVEVEAMHGASTVALTIYDMLKPIDQGVEIESIKLVSKAGGKSQYKADANTLILASVVVCSDSISAGKKEDKAGKSIIQKLKESNIHVDNYIIIQDDKAVIQQKAKEFSQSCHLLIFTGGTGLSQRDVTPEAIKPLLDREIPGIMEAARNYGQERIPYSMLSRGIAGMMGKTLVLTLPGSTKGATESMNCLFPYVLHLMKVAKGYSHEELV
jgi:cyclic pyranopterin monophosphate synthase